MPFTLSILTSSLVPQQPGRPLSCERNLLTRLFSDIYFSDKDEAGDVSDSGVVGAAQPLYRHVVTFRPSLVV
jgi:hypothetical protein